MTNDIVNSQAEKDRKTRRDAMGGCGCFVVIVLIAAFIFFGIKSESHDVLHSNYRESQKGEKLSENYGVSNGVKEKGIRTLNASVSMEERGFRITNQELFELTEVKISIDPGLISDGYYCSVVSIKTGASIFLPFSEFADSDGKRFSITEIKPREFRIIATITGEFSIVSITL